MITECKKNLSLVEEVLFDCSTFESTGILACKLLLGCLERAREYKTSSLKCMRYILRAIDNLFVISLSRPSLMIALCVYFND